MITLRRDEERHHEQRHRQDVWHTFHAVDRAYAITDGFGALDILIENRLPPGAKMQRHPHRDAEIITYVRDGALLHEDSRGRSGIIQAGEFHCRIAHSGDRNKGTNASRADWAHVFQIGLRSLEAEREPGDEQKRFCIAQRRGVLCVVASPDGRGGSLRIHQTALVCSAVLDPGQHVVHELAPRHRVWLHIVQGEVVLGDVVLTTGDAASVEAERAVSLTAREETEVLLVDLDAEQRRSIRLAQRGLPAESTTLRDAATPSQ